MIFGRSLHVDLYGISEQVCDDLSFCYSLLDELVDFLEMTKQSPPFIFRSPNEYPDKAGLSGWVPVIESGISIHTLIPQKFITLDIYTCGELHVEKVLSFLEKKLRPSRFEHYYLDRGIEYGKQ